MAFGLTSEGFVPMTAADIRADINARVWATISPTLDLSDRTFEGQLIGIVAYHIALCWELAEASNATFDVDKAVKAALDAICLLTGTFRRSPTESTVTLTLTGDPTTLITAGHSARVTDGPRFDTLEDATLVALTPWAVGTLYAIADRVTANANVYQCTEAGTSDVSGDGPTSIDPLEDIIDATVHWRFLGAGTAADDAESQASETGELAANAGTITEVVTPVGGWNGVVNVLDAEVGRGDMSDAELRVLRELELAQPGTSPADSIAAALLGVAGVTSATVFVNNTDATNGDGMPPHSVEAMVRGGDDQDIWDTLLANVAAGIATHGTEVGTSTDSQGTDHTMKFTRADEIEIYVVLTLTKDPDEYPADGDALVKTAITEFGANQSTGKDAVAWSIGAQAIKVPGVLEVTSCFIGTAPAPGTSATVAISTRQLATYDTLRISVTSSDATP